MTPRVSKTLGGMKHKAIDIDKVTTDFVIPGGDESLKQFTKLVNQIRR